MSCAADSGNSILAPIPQSKCSTRGRAAAHRSERKDGGDDGGSIRRIRLSRVEDGNEAIELAKLAAADEMVERQKEELELVQKIFAEVEAKMECLDYTNGDSFNNFNAFQQKRLGSAEAYYNSLEKERFELCQEKDALHNQIGGSLYYRGAQKEAVTEV